MVNSHEIISKGVEEEEDGRLADLIAKTGKREGEGEGGREGGIRKLLVFVNYFFLVLHLLLLLLLLLLSLWRPWQRESRCPPGVTGCVES